MQTSASKVSFQVDAAQKVIAHLDQNAAFQLSQEVTEGQNGSNAPVARTPGGKQPTLSSVPNAANSRRASPRFKNVITPFTPHEHDVGLLLVSMKSPQPLRSTAPDRSKSQTARGVGLGKGTSSAPLSKSAVKVAATPISKLSRRTPSSTPLVINKKAANKFTYQLTFPEMVQQMISESAETNPDVINWTHDGEAFTIKDKHKNIRSVIGKHFSHGKYGSLQRQLNMYGWSKHLMGKYKGSFFNPDFHRDFAPEQIGRIKRRGPPAQCKGKKRFARAKAASDSRRIAATAAVSESTSDGEEWRPKSASAGGKTKTRQRRATKKALSKNEPDEASLPLKKRTPGQEATNVSGLTTPANHPGASLGAWSAANFGQTPADSKSAFYSFDTSPHTPWSPIFPGLHLQGPADDHKRSTPARNPPPVWMCNSRNLESSNAFLSEAECDTQPPDFYMHWSGVNCNTPSTRHHIGENAWARASSPLVSTGGLHDQNSDHRVIGNQKVWPPVGNTAIARSESENRTRPVQRISPASNFHKDQSVPTSNGESNNLLPSTKLDDPNYIAPLPLLAREPSNTIAPLPLVQRSSSSFYFPFVGHVDTLRSALGADTSPQGFMSV